AQDRRFIASLDLPLQSDPPTLEGLIYPDTYYFHRGLSEARLLTAMVEQFKKHGVKHELISIPKGEHGLGGGDPKLINAAYESAFAFINKHMKE
ncbi:MAG: hypothetical protein IH991_02460, partial [Planctomycetes bacterium]|nr:hypothetical protein [Planctomycetota bacterium]